MGNFIRMILLYVVPSDDVWMTVTLGAVVSEDWAEAEEEEEEDVVDMSLPVTSLLWV